MPPDNEIVADLCWEEHAPSSEKEKTGEMTPHLRETIHRFTPGKFKSWWRERQFVENVRNGQPYFNGPSPVPEPTRHSPSQLVQCSRQIYYQQKNAPEETDDPHGIFWTGSRFEEDIVIPFLESEIAADDQYISNSLWIDFIEPTEAGELRLKGATDPVIVTADYEPILLTEIKTKRSVEHIDQPNKHHKAQAHAYLRGLSEKYDAQLSHAVILYGSRVTFDIKAFHVHFDPEFWRETVLTWAEQHTTHRLNEDLPPAEPEYDWECKFCSYKERCGKGQREFEDEEPSGLLPLFTEYPREKLVEYLEAHESTKLTPALAHEFSKLTDEYGVYDWTCRGCGETFAWDAVSWTPTESSPPRCPRCQDNGEVRLLSGPRPSQQQSVTGGKGEDV